MKTTMFKGIKLEGIIYQKVSLGINIIINGKKFHDQLTNSDAKRYDEIRRLTTGQGEEYTT